MTSISQNDRIINTKMKKSCDEKEYLIHTACREKRVGATFHGKIKEGSLGAAGRKPIAASRNRRWLTVKMSDGIIRADRGVTV